ncbi:MAG: four helix bundle suffix domain-containing protein [Desulfococcaceae bacterium]|jgi:four helix bundle suffix protein|nr:four helix bundle suffix domain-containing protein [Desulfococcaceae bacterium]
MKTEPLIPKHGGYRNLKSFQVAQLVYDITIRFCARYVDRFSRTKDQMVQAARSGVQNIAEGSMAAGTSKKTELKLTNVARASLEELKLDYEDFLRHRGLPQWDRNDPRRVELIDRRLKTVDEISAWVKDVHDRGRQAIGGLSGLNGQCGQGRQGNCRAPVNRPGLSAQPTMSTQSAVSTKTTYREIAANAALALIAVASALLDRQIAAQAKAFEEEGGFTERLYRVRRQTRQKRQGF